MYKFKNQTLEDTCFTHRSYVHQERNKGNLESNERLEFLGDAVLDLWTTQTLFHMFPNFDEGKLSTLYSLITSSSILATIAKEIGLDTKIKLSRTEEENGGRTNSSILEDTFEAYIGAMYLDSGFDQTSLFLESKIKKHILTLSKQKHYKDPKTYFQEIVQAKTGITPHYKTISESGPDHKKLFEVGVFIEDQQISVGFGASKLLAEKDASSKATQIYESKL